MLATERSSKRPVVSLYRQRKEQQSKRNTERRPIMNKIFDLIPRDSINERLVASVRKCRLK